MAAAVDARHKWVFAKVGEALNQDPQAVQDAVAKSGKMPQVTEFFKETGPRKVLFYYQPPQMENEFGDTVPVPDSKPRILVNDGTTEPLRGRCVYFIRITPRAVNPAKIEEEVVAGQLEANVLGELQETLKQVRSCACVVWPCGCVASLAGEVVLGIGND